MSSSFDVFVLRVAGVERDFGTVEANGSDDGGDGGGFVADVTGTGFDGDTEERRKRMVVGSDQYEGEMGE